MTWCNSLDFGRFGYSVEFVIEKEMSAWYTLAIYYEFAIKCIAKYFIRSV